MRGHLDRDGNEIIGPCCVCKAEATLRCLPAPVSDFWCDECEDIGRVPYNFMVGRYAMLNPQYANRKNAETWDCHKATLAYFAKTEDECWADVERKRVELAEYYKAARA